MIKYGFILNISDIEDVNKKRPVWQDGCIARPHFPDDLNPLKEHPVPTD